jgi:hypothetical protein
MVVVWRILGIVLISLMGIALSLALEHVAPNQKWWQLIPIAFVS